MGFNLADLFEGIVDVVGDREVLVVGDRRLTYAQLDERANRLAHHLQSLGIGPGDHVGVYLRNGSEYVECMLAAFKVRAVPVNVNYRYVTHELRYLFDDADIQVVVHEPEFAETLAEVRPDLPKLRHAVARGHDYEAALAASSPERGFPPRSPDDLFIIYTGGTTGMPKGVMWRHEDIFFAGMAGGNPAGEPLGSPEEVTESARTRDPAVTFPVAPLMHGAAELATFITFHWGGRLVLTPRFDPDEVWRLVEAEHVNTITIVGDAMARPMAEALDVADPRPDTSSLFVISSAGAILSGTVREQLQANLPEVMVLDSFGSTETGFLGTQTADSGPERGLRFTMNARSAVLDDDRKPVVPGSGVVGHVALRGHIPLGYYNDAEKTANTFVEVDGERWSITGDMATVEADGTVLVYGRGSVCINTGGEKVFPEEVEAALKSHPEVFDAVVVGVVDERWGERVAALVQARPGSTPTVAELDAHCRTRVAGYKVPRQITFVDSMERSPSGKADYPWARKVAAGT